MVEQGAGTFQNDRPRQTKGGRASRATGTPDMTPSVWLWVGFTLFVLAMLALDLGVFHRKAHAVSFKEALGWTAVWLTLALLFGAGVWHFAGYDRALEF